MPWVTSEETYEAFITGRDVNEAVHNEDGTPGCAGWVKDEDVRKTDTVVTRSGGYTARLATVMTYNAKLRAS